MQEDVTARLHTAALKCDCSAAQDLRKVAGEELSNVEQDLDRESREDSELKERYGPAWHRPGSAALNSTLREKIAGGLFWFLLFWALI